MSKLNVTNIAGPSNTGTAAILNSINGGPISGARNRIINKEEFEAFRLAPRSF